MQGLSTAGHPAGSTVRLAMGPLPPHRPQGAHDEPTYHDDWPHPHAAPRAAHTRNGLLDQAHVARAAHRARVALAASGAIYQVVATARDRRAYPPPGHLVDMGGYSVHLTCLGAGSPTVILLHGNGGSSLDWYGVQPAIAATTRVCAYDRAGSGWSDAGPGPQDAHRQSARPAHAAHQRRHPRSLRAGRPFVWRPVHPPVCGPVPRRGRWHGVARRLHPDQWTRTPQGPTVYATLARQVRLQALLARIGLSRLLVTPRALPPGTICPLRASRRTGRSSPRPATSMLRWLNFWPIRRRWTPSGPRAASGRCRWRS